MVNATNLGYHLSEQIDETAGFPYTVSPAARYIDVLNLDAGNELDLTINYSDGSSNTISVPTGKGWANATKPIAKINVATSTSFKVAFYVKVGDI